MSQVEMPADVFARARDIERICRAHGVALPAAAVQYPLRFPQVVSVVAGMRGASQADEAAERLAAPLPDELWRSLADAGHILVPEGVA